MAGEAQAVDIAEKPTPEYLKTVIGHLQQQAEPQSFWEHNASSFIPFVGPIAHSLANDRRQARINQATMNTGLFDTLVQQGYLPDGPEATAIGQKLGIPDAVLRAGILESAKVRATPSYQARQQFSAALPTFSPQLQGPYLSEDLRTADEQRVGAANLQDWINRYPEFAAAIGNPEAARVGFERQEYEKADALSDSLGMPTSRGGTTPSAPAQSPQRPLGASPSPSSAPSVPSAPAPLSGPPSATPVPQPGLPAGAGQPTQPEGQPGGQQSSQVPFVSPAVLQARTAYVQLAPEMRQRLEDAVQAAVVKYPNVSRGEALAIAGIESQFNPQAQGPVTKEGWRALGLMQISPGVIGKYNVTDPLNIAQNVNAGVAEYARLKDLYKGNTQLALAAYDAGEGTVGQYGGIPPYPETKAYVQNVPQVQQWLDNHPYAQSLTPTGQGSPMLVAGEGTAPGPQQTPGQAPAVAQIPLPAPGQTPQALPPGIDPLGQFNVRGQPVVIKSATVGVSGGKRHFDITLQTPAERAFAYAGFWTLQNPDNFPVALKDVTGKGVALAPEQVKSLQEQAVGPSLAFHYAQARADTRLSEAQARQQAATRTLQSIGIAPTPAQLDALGNPARLAGETTEAQRAAETAEGLSKPAQDLRVQKQADEAAGKEQGRLASRVTSEQQQNFLLPDGSSPPPSMTQKALEDAGARELGKETINHLDQVNLIQDNLRAMQTYADEYAKLSFGSKVLPGTAESNLQTRYETQRRATARLLDKLANVGGERERIGGGGGIGIGPVRIGAFGTDMKQLLDALPSISAANASVHIGEAIATAQTHKDIVWRRAFGTGAP